MFLIQQSAVRLLAVIRVTVIFRCLLKMRFKYQALLVVTGRIGEMNSCFGDSGRRVIRAHYSVFLLAVAFLAVVGFSEVSGELVLAEESLVIEAVVASVDGNPITLGEVRQRLGRGATLKEIVSDAEARAAVDALIQEHLVKAEAEQRKLSVTDEEISDYLDEVAKRNGLSKEGLIEALKGQNMSLDRYREQVKLDILKARIAGVALRGGVAISDEEINKYVAAHPRQFPGGNTVELRQILLLSSKHSAAGAREKLAKLRERVKDGEEDFSDLAKQFSEGPEAADGGSLGEVREADLNPAIFDAVLSLEEGDVSDVVETDSGYHIFYVEDRDKREVEVTEAQRQEIKRQLENQAVEAKASTLFTEEITKNHSVERKF